MSLKMHFGSAKGKGQILCPSSYTLNKNQVYSWGTPWLRALGLVYQKKYSFAFNTSLMLGVGSSLVCDNDQPHLSQ